MDEQTTPWNGYPLSCDDTGWHWLQQVAGTALVRGPFPAEWIATRQLWRYGTEVSPERMASWTAYLAPCPLPANWEAKREAARRRPAGVMVQ